MPEFFKNNKDDLREKMDQFFRAQDGDPVFNIEQMEALTDLKESCITLCKERPALIKSLIAIDESRGGKENLSTIFESIENTENSWIEWAVNRGIDNGYTPPEA